jgi:hypothetical protein
MTGLEQADRKSLIQLWPDPARQPLCPAIFKNERQQWSVRNLSSAAIPVLRVQEEYCAVFAKFVSTDAVQFGTL